MGAPKEFKLYLGGEWKPGAEKLTVLNPFDQSPVGVVHTADERLFSRAIDIAEAAFPRTRALPSHGRQRILSGISQGIEARGEEFARTISMEMGKTIKEARTEVGRAVSTFAIAGEEAKRIGGELMDLDWAPGHEGRLGIIRRFPIGIIAGITPFNFPLNLVAHKVAPAIASGNPIIIKPASKTPITALLLAQVVDATEIPRGALSVLPGSGGSASPLIEDERVKLLTFTGSAAVGWTLRERAKKKRVTLELGGNAGVIVGDDADLDTACGRIVAGGFALAGQSCISVQRVFVHEKVMETFLARFLPRVEGLKMGNPLDESTELGPMVEKDAADKVLRWIEAARAKGANVLTGGTAENSMLHPTVLTGVDPKLELACREAFAPIVVVEPYGDFEKALEAVNNSEYGLQAGVFTNRFGDIWRAFEVLDVGGVVVNDVPTYRADQMPYGGTKASGTGREGLKYAIEEMTELKILAINLGAS